ncbi:hypothetical protein HY357_04695 [Candidatus Roizmanbacteria bacterium]|nr:hypothetical protein [Candidatus Roizmanbacteria bacterium]
MTTDGIFGPFDNKDDVDKYWYQVKEKELEKWIDKIKKDLQGGKKLKENTNYYKNELIELSKELKYLRESVDNYWRCLERFKNRKKIINQVNDDWYNFNRSLWSDYIRTQRMGLDSNLTEGEGLKQIQREFTHERIKREEIIRRLKKILQ